VRTSLAVNSPGKYGRFTRHSEETPPIRPRATGESEKTCEIPVRRSECRNGSFFGVSAKTFELMTQSVPVSDVRRNLSFNRRDVSKRPNRLRLDLARPAIFEDGLVFNYWIQAKRRGQQQSAAEAATRGMMFCFQALTITSTSCSSRSPSTTSIFPAEQSGHGDT
jgi:hypothetical protein